MLISTARELRGTVNLPGDKSISHRAAMLSALANGETRIKNFAGSLDCASTLNCIRSLGINVRNENGVVVINGSGGNFSAPREHLDCGNSGTTMRLMAGILAGQAFDSVLTGDESLSKRPMMRIVTPLARMGAVIETTEGHAPLSIKKTAGLKGLAHELKVASAQLKSCLLLAGLFADGETSVVEKTETRDHTERMLRWLGAELIETPSEDGKKITVRGRQKLTARDVDVPGDVSSAAFFLVGAACLEKSDLVILNVGLNSTRTAVIDTLVRFGANIVIENTRESGGEPIGDIRVRGGLNEPKTLGNNLIDGKIIANLIDEIPILAVFGTQLEGGLEVRGAGELRVKESDRIAAVVRNLKAMNAEVEEFADGFRVSKSRLSGAELETFHDHRIAMAFAVAGLMAEGETKILNAACADVSFPGFFDALAGVTA